MRRKEIGRSINTITKGTQQSGISKPDKLPQVFSYPKLLNYNTVFASFNNLMCYVIKHYGDIGLSVLIYRQQKIDQVVVICGDWSGNSIDIQSDTPLARIADKFLKESLSKFISMMKLVNLEQAQLFFSVQNDELTLVDMQLSINKMAGPGMIRDIFGRIYKTQEIVKVEVLDERAVNCIKEGSGSYAGDIIIKPSRYRLYEDGNNNYTPMYAEMLR